MSTFPVPSKVPELSTQQDILDLCTPERKIPRRSRQSRNPTKLGSPADRKREETAIERRRVLFYDYMETSFLPSWIEYKSDGGIQRDDTHGRRHDRHAQTADKRQDSYRLRDICPMPSRVFNGPSLRETPPTNQTTETVKNRIISLEILLHAQRQTIMRQGRSTKTVPVYISVFIHQRHAVTGRMLFDPFR